jgi:glycine cleavage system aminomethyltransferase T
VEAIFIILMVIAVCLISIFFLLKLLAERYLLLLNKYHLNRYEKIINKKKQQKTNKPDEFLSKDQKQEQKEIDEMQQEMLSGVEVINQKGKGTDLILAHQQVVDLAKPVGKFSSMIIKQKIGFIMALAGLKNQFAKDGQKVGAWRLFIKAQAMSKKFEKGQGR